RRAPRLPLEHARRGDDATLRPGAGPDRAGPPPVPSGGRALELVPGPDRRALPGAAARAAGLPGDRRVPLERNRRERADRAASGGAGGAARPLPSLPLR